VKKSDVPFPVAAKDKELIDWAYERSVRFHVPENVSVEWDAP